MNPQRVRLILKKKLRNFKFKLEKLLKKWTLKWYFPGLSALSSDFFEFSGEIFEFSGPTRG